MEMQLKAFYGQFPSLNRSDELLAKIYAAAEQQHIALESGAYRLTEPETGNIRRYQITLPIKGSHVQIRRFLTDTSGRSSRPVAGRYQLQARNHRFAGGQRSDKADAFSGQASMNVSQKKRWAVLLGLLAISMASAFLAPDENEEAKPAVPAKKAAQEGNREKQSNVDASELQLDKLKRNELAGRCNSDIFPSKSWYVPPPPPKPVPPPPPAPPPIPFVYLGKMLKTENPLVFLSKQERNLVVREGDVIEGSYRVESILPPVMTLTYLPLNMQQTIPNWSI